MHLDCPECKTKFLVDPAQLGEKGKKVRCGKCLHVWFQQPAAPEVKQVAAEVKQEQKENLQKAVEDQAKGIEPSLPSVVVVKPVPKHLKTLFLLLLIFNALAFVMLNRDVIGQTAFYDLVGQYSSQGVIIQRAEITEIKKTKDKNIYTVNWAVKNTNDHKIKLPARRVAIQNEQGQEVAQSEVIKIPKMLGPGEVFEIKAHRIEDETKEGKYIVLDIGSPAELAVR